MRHLRLTGRFIVGTVCLLLATFLILAISGPHTASRFPDANSIATAAPPAAKIAANQNPTPAANRNEKPSAIVVGAGISGLTAALELTRGGADVTLIDMSSVFGGHAVMSQGSVSIVGTPLQQASGVRDSPDLAFQDIVKFGEDADRTWARYYVDNSRKEIYDWALDLGIRFTEVVASPGNSVEREHQPVGRGIGLVTPIYRACLEQPNLRFVWNSKVEKLLTEQGRVTGVISRDLRSQEEVTYKAGAVILATGGFQSNLDMVREYWPAEFRFPDKILVGSGRNSTGIGHRLAESAGGELVKMDHQWNYYTGIPDPRYPGTKRGLSAINLFGIIVNPDGKRFANMHGWAKEVMPPLLKQKEATLWFIFDEATRANVVVSGTDWADFKVVEKLILNDPKLVQSAPTLEKLAEKTGLPPKNLVETLRRYNELVAKGVDDDFHRFGPGRPAFSNKTSPPLKTPPYYAMQAFPLTRKSMGGVAIDMQCRVLDKQKQPIPGLYAVGELTGLAGINGKAAIEGTFLGPCIVTGRVAARTILGTSKQIAAQNPPQTGSRCSSCHDIRAEIAKPRPGYWHFENVHKVILQRGLDCRTCHAELTPYREANHRINPQALTASCVQCHTATE